MSLMLFSWARLIPAPLQLFSPFQNLKGLIRTILPPATLDWNILQLNRNARKPKKANHGSRPNSSVMRRLKKRQFYKKWKESTPAELQEDTDIPKPNDVDDDE